MVMMRGVLLWLLITGGLLAQEGLVVTTPRSYGGGNDFGHQVEVFPDVNGDGWLDIAAATPVRDPVGRDGQVEVRSGRDGSVIWRVMGPRPAGEFGMGMTLLPDQTGDGIPEIAALAKAGGTGSIPFGTEIRVLSGADGTLLGGMILNKSQAGRPRIVPTIDMTNDGVPELIVGALSDLKTEQAGDLFVVDPVQRQILLRIPCLAGFTISPNTANFGITLEIAPDLSGDGVPEITVGFPRQEFSGLVRVFDGASGAVYWESTGLTGVTGLGRSFAWCPDRNGDGVEDLVVGAPGHPATYFYNQMGSGHVLILDGGSGAPLELVTGYADIVGFGESVAWVSSAQYPTERLVVGGRVDAQNAATPEELLTAAADLGWTSVGWAPRRRFALEASVSRTGSARVAVGDLNGDGHSDVVLGTPGAPYDPYGAVHVFLTQAAVPYGAGNPAVHRITLQAWLDSNQFGFSFRLDAFGPTTASGTPSALVIGVAPDDRPLNGGRLLVDLTDALVMPGIFQGAGMILTTSFPESPLPGWELFFQLATIDPTAPEGLYLSDGYRLTL